MQTSSIPSKYTYAFGSGASPSYIRSVPATTADPVAASQLTGFPPDTFLPTDSGGTPPDGRDFNGLYNQITAWQIWNQAGGPIAYDGTFQTNIGGYPRNAIVMSATTPGKFWMSTTENNVTNPDTGGAGWTSWIFGSGLASAVTSITFGLGLAGGTITSTGNVSLLQASTSQLGGVKVDGTSIIISGGGVISATTGGTGSVSQVGLAMPSIFTVSGSPVTTSGTLTAALANQSANLFFAGPSTGSAAAPTFRALASADMPAATNLARGAVQVDNVTTFMTGSVIRAAVGVTGVAASGGTTGLTFSGSPITTSGTFTLGGTLGIPNGGTGSGTQSGARTNLGLGTLAVLNSPLGVANGGTGGTDQASGRSGLGAAASGANNDITRLYALANGTVSVPTLTWAGGQGFFGTGSNTVSFSTGGVQSFIFADNRAGPTSAAYLAINAAAGVPGTSTSTIPFAGALVYDTNYLYLSIGVNQWRRIALSTF